MTAKRTLDATPVFRLLFIAAFGVTLSYWLTRLLFSYTVAADLDAI